MAEAKMRPGSRDAHELLSELSREDKRADALRLLSLSDVDLAVVSEMVTENLRLVRSSFPGREIC
ncbi:hypothetical protein [Gordonibacter sp.]|uniref:hypothetical protein n=1 Tax=Gordonibacter sp. TaxID=1968902 RepID=UPI002FC9D7AC